MIGVLADIALSTAVKYVAAAYAIVWFATLVYVWLLRAKLGRLERELAEAERLLAERPVAPAAPDAAPAQPVGV